jgi:hypothetical protein
MPPLEKEAHFDNPMETGNGFPEKALLVVVLAAQNARGDS